MDAFAELVKQHKEILDIIGDIFNDATPTITVKDSENFFKLLKRLSIVLTDHLDLEDNCLYPELKKKSGKIRDLAVRFYDEFGGLQKAVEKYLTIWSSPENIYNDYLVFYSDTSNINSLLRNRIEKEEKELFILFKKENKSS